MASVQTSSYGGRYIKLTVVEESYSIANNTSTVRWTLESIGGSSNYYTIYHLKAVVNGTTMYSEKTTEWDTKVFPAAKGSQTGTLVITHGTDGKIDPISFSLYGAVYYNSPKTYSGTLPLTDIPRQADITSAPNFNDEANPKITYSNPAGNSVSSLQACISLTGSADDVPYRDISKTGTEYTFNLTTAERNTLLNACTTANSRSVIFYVKTVIGGNTFYSTLTRTLSIVNGNPTFTTSNVSYQDTNSTIVAITGNNQHIVRNKSSLRVTIGTATPKKNASISRYEITFNGSTQSKTSAGNVDYGQVNIGSNTTVTVKAIDSRGNSTSVSKTITILDWVNPTAIISAGRVNNYENTTKIKAQVSISSVNSKNAIQELKYRYKNTTSSSWSSYVSFSNNVETSLSLDKNYAWDFQIYIVDKFGNTTYNFTVAKGMPIMFFDTNKISVGINKFPSNNNSLDVDTINGKSILNLTYPVGSIYMSVNSTNPGTLFGGTWVQLQNRFLLGAGSSYSNGATGGSATVTLNVNQIPAHTHTQASCTNPGDHSHYIPNARSTQSSGSPPKFESWPTCTGTARDHYTNGSGSHTHTITLNNTGGSQAHDNMPPYLVVYMWKRTA